MSETWHRDLIAALTFALRPDFYLELGCGSLGTISKVTAKRRVGVDVTPYKSADPTIEIFTGSCNEYHAFFMLDPVPIDVLFIDSNHSKESVWEDFDHFYPYVKKNGYILLHDTAPADERATNAGRCGTAWQAVMKIKQLPVEVLTIVQHPGLTIVRKGTAQIQW